VITLVDARNVLRSRWPNVPGEELVDLIRAWSAAHGAHAYIVFDGRAPGGVVGERELDPHAVLVGSGGESADDWIVRRAAELDEPYVLVTSDRELRSRAGPGAERTIGGGSFARTLTRAVEP
jgi:predicted RNA-binding protein with PIN domain